MNIGQILETHLGWAAKGLGAKIGKMLEAPACRRGAAQVLRIGLQRGPAARRKTSSP